MAVLTFVACLIYGGGCAPGQIPGEVPLSLCLSRGQEQLARWQAHNPEWRIQSWKCVPAGKGKNI